MEQVEQPHKYRAFLFHVPKNEYGTHGTNFGIVPLVPCSKNEDETEITASTLAVPCVPPVPPKNICLHRKNVRSRIMLNPNIFSRHIKKSAEHMEQVEQPHKYRAFLFHVPKNEYGTHGTEHAPPVPPKNMSEIKNAGLNPKGEVHTMFTCGKIREGRTYLGGHLTANDYTA